MGCGRYTRVLKATAVVSSSQAITAYSFKGCQAEKHQCARTDTSIESQSQTVVSTGCCSAVEIPRTESLYLIDHGIMRCTVHLAIHSDRVICFMIIQCTVIIQRSYLAPPVDCRFLTSSTVRRLVGRPLRSAQRGQDQSPSGSSSHSKPMHRRWKLLGQVSHSARGLPSG